MVPIHNRGAFSPSPAHSIVTAGSHSPHNSVASSPTASSSLTKIVVAQVYLLLSTIREDKDRTKWELQAEQLRKLIDDHGMEVFQKYFTRLVVGNAGQIFPGLNRPVANTGNYQILVNEVRKITQDVGQAEKIAESIETANEDIFRDFDLSTFMEHFRMDALEKTILALAFKTTSRGDLKSKADAILSTNYSNFTQILATPNSSANDLNSTFVATIVDRYLQEPYPNFDDRARTKLEFALRTRYSQVEQDLPSEVLASLYLSQIPADRYPLVALIRQIGPSFTADEDICTKLLHNAKNLKIDEEQIAVALIYSVISRTPKVSTTMLAGSLRKEFKQTDWVKVVAQFDRENLRVTSSQFLALYNSFKPIAEVGGDVSFNIAQLWAGRWENSETQLSFINAFCSLKPDELDATTIPDFTPSFTIDDYAGCAPGIQERAAQGVKQTLVSALAIQAIFDVALQENRQSETVEAKRLFQEVVVPNLDVFLVSAFSVTKPWPELAKDTINSLFDRFVRKLDANYDFVLESLWRKDRNWVTERLIEAHGARPLELPMILEHALNHKWLEDLIQLLNGFGLDLASLAHSKDLLDLNHWRELHEGREHDLSQMLLTFLDVKIAHELESQRVDNLLSVMLPVKTISALLTQLTLIEDKSINSDKSTRVQRLCITAYPRLVNYGVGFDDVIDENGKLSNVLPIEANMKMEEYYKRMYNEEIRVVEVVNALESFKLSRIHADQDVFACMIHGLFDEYALYNTYPLEALKTTALLFGGIIKHRLLPEFPLEIALGMILEAIKDHAEDPSAAMYKFGVEALKQTFDLFPLWPGFCKRLLEEIPSEYFRSTDAWAKALEVLQQQEQENFRSGGNGVPGGVGVDGDVNGNFDDMLSSEPVPVPFSAVNADPPPMDAGAEDPSSAIQERFQFLLNNITEANLEEKFGELKEIMEKRYQRWFAAHLVDERAKTQQNYHGMYMTLVKLFDDKDLWNAIIRRTHYTVSRMLNAQSTIDSQAERKSLFCLAEWLGKLTLARDKPIKHRDIAFKALLLQAYHSQRLIVVVPFVCNVLVQGRLSTIFRPPNPWLMDILSVLMELYKDGGLKLNQKFAIEVLFKELGQDQESIEPSSEIRNSIPAIEEADDAPPSDALDHFDNGSLNGAGGGIGSGRFSPEEISSSLPDLGPLLNYPPVIDLGNQQPRMQEMIKQAITQAIREIIAPVVERSVTIAALSTAQMIHKDFATEPDENRVREAAISMVKRTAGSLALVTSKEPLRASMSTYIRQYSGDIFQGSQVLPEGAIMMIVNSNLDMACGQVEKKAEERAVPEIEEMIESDIQLRRIHRQNRPNDPFYDPALSRWAMTIPNPYKLMPGTTGLNMEQMAIYNDFAKQRAITNVTSSHGPSSSDATRSMANDVLQDQYSVQALPTASEIIIHNNNSLPQSYGQPLAQLPNGRGQNQVDEGMIAERLRALLHDLINRADGSVEHHFSELVAPHPILEVIDAILTFVLRYGQLSSGQQWDVPSKFAAEIICELLFRDQVTHDLAIESLVHLLDNFCKFPDGTSRAVRMTITQQPDEAMLKVPLAIALVQTDTNLLDWHRVDLAAANGIIARKPEALEFIVSIIERTLLVQRPLALYTDFSKSLDAIDAWVRTDNDSSAQIGAQLIEHLKASGFHGTNPTDARSDAGQDQLEYEFEEWIHLCNIPKTSEKARRLFTLQLYEKRNLDVPDDLCAFIRLCFDVCVERFEQILQNGGLQTDSYIPIDALAALFGYLVSIRGENSNKANFLDSLLSLVVLILNQQHIVQGEAFNQKVFCRFFSTLMSELEARLPALTRDTLASINNEVEETSRVIASTLLKVKPAVVPGFTFGWIALISHRDFLPKILAQAEAGWPIFMDIMESLILFCGEYLKPLQLSDLSHSLYKAIMKIFVVINHDYPEFFAANHVKLCAWIPPSCIQLLNVVLSSSRSAVIKVPDPLQPGLRLDLVEGIRASPLIDDDLVAIPLQNAGLRDLIDSCLQHSSSEEAVATIAHAIQNKTSHLTTTGNVPIKVNLRLVDAIVLYLCQSAIEKATDRNGPTFIQASPEANLLIMLIGELNAEARYYFLTSMVNQLRYPNAHTGYFSQAILDIFAWNMRQTDQQSFDIREQIVRILLERHLGNWPQPWGLMVTILELIKSDKYNFFDLSFIKATPEVSDQFKMLLQRAQ